MFSQIVYSYVTFLIEVQRFESTDSYVRFVFRQIQRSVLYGALFRRFAHFNIQKLNSIIVLALKMVKIKQTSKTMPAEEKFVLPFVLSRPILIL